MRPALALVAVLLVCACSHDTEWDGTGECAAPDGSTPIATTAIELFDPPCFAATSGGGADSLFVVGSQAEWDALFTCPTDVPAGLDLATQRAAVVGVYCAPIDQQFVAETPSEIVVGVLTHPSGACIGNLLVVPLAPSSKPVRFARCAESCDGDCPPLP